MIIRPEKPSDIESVHRLTHDAFAAGELGHNGEAPLVDTLRRMCPEALALVAELDGALVGHILFTPATIGEGAGAVAGMGLAPMSVSPAHQRQGIGSALIHEGLRLLRSDGVPFVVVLGHPEYYPKFGFHPAREHGVECDFPEVPAELFMMQLLTDDAPAVSGTARYHPAFYNT